MRDLVLVGFTNEPHRAAAVLADARETEEPWTGDLRDAVAVYRDPAGTLIVDRAHEPSRFGVVIASLLTGAFVGLPVAALLGPIAVVVGSVVGGIVGMRRGAGSDWWSELAIPRELRRVIRPNDSAIFVRCPVARQSEVLRWFGLVRDARVMAASHTSVAPPIRRAI